MNTSNALAPTTEAQRKLGDSMHWMMFHTSDGLSELWERGNSAVRLPDRPDASPFVKGYWREIAPFMVAMGAQIPGFRIIPHETAAEYLAARTAFYDQKDVDNPRDTNTNWTRLEAAEETLAVTLGGTRLLPTKDQTTLVPELGLNIAHELAKLAAAIQPAITDLYNSGAGYSQASLEETRATLLSLSAACELKVLVEPIVADHPGKRTNNYVVMLPGGLHLEGAGPTIEAAVDSLQAVLNGGEPAPIAERRS